jgi:peptidoglycan/LPS O-acetylase OafA/YrhL
MVGHNPKPTGNAALGNPGDRTNEYTDVEGSNRRPRGAPADVEAVNRPPSATPSRLGWLDPLRALGILLIVGVHIVEQIFGGMLAGNPTADWGTTAARFAQWEPLGGFGLWSPLVNLARWVGWLGDHGVSLFIIASGAALTWSAYARPASGGYGAYLRHRVLRLYPLWLGSHVLLLLAIWAGAVRFHTEPFVLSVVGLRITPESYFYGVPAWWYFTLALILSALFPPLFALMRRLGALRFLLIVGGGTLVIRLIGLELLTGTAWVDLWSRGAFGVTRIPEFAVGMVAAVAWRTEPDRWTRTFRSGPVRVACLLAAVVGVLASFTLLGMTVSYLLVGVGISGLVAGVDWSRMPIRFSRAVGWLGVHSYGIFLTHQLLVLALVPRGLDHGYRTLVGVALALVLTVVVTLLLERAVARVGRWASRTRRVRGSLAGTMLVVAPVVVLLAAVPAADLTVRQFDAREANGWGERSSLSEDATVGWKLRPSSVTRLRWNSYDYTVTANALGFPGPDVTPQRPAGALRVLTVGDAYTSAEGVDTAQSWPRLLESDLTRSTGRPVQVQNFAITGYGPNQYLAVLREYLPVYQPDLVVIAMSFTDFDDVQTTVSDFQDGIGFGRAAAEGVDSVLSADQLRQWVKDRSSTLVRDVTGQTDRLGYSFGGFSGLDVSRRADLERGALASADRLDQIRAVAGQYGARLSVMMIPPPAAVCRPADLPYFPSHVDLADRTSYDPAQTSELTREMAGRSGIAVHDLGDALRSAPAGCPYMPDNLHWTAAGQAWTAEVVSRLPELTALVDHQG